MGLPESPMEKYFKIKAFKIFQMCYYFYKLGNTYKGTKVKKKKKSCRTKMGGQLVLIPVAASSTRLIIQRRGLFLLSGKSRPPFSPGNQIRHFSFTKSSFSFSEALIQKQQEGSRSFAAARSSLEPPDLPRLTETARISLTQDEVSSSTTQFPFSYLNLCVHCSLNFIVIGVG